LLVSLGGIGLGLVWGWLLGSLEGRVSRPLRSVLFLSIATLLLGVEVLVFADVSKVLLFLGSATLSLLLRIGWQHELRRHSQSSKLTRGEENQLCTCFRL
jgi:NhaP-type Na+/H+ or K+/H+ antiporter